MGLRLITPAPADTPVTLAQAKAHLRVDHTDEDALITAQIEAATEYVETLLGRALVDQTWDLILDAFPGSMSTLDSFVSTWVGTFAAQTGVIKIPKPPLIEVLSINYNDTSGNDATMPSSDYYVDTTSRYGWIVTQGGASWPETLDAINAVRIRFRAGYMDYSSSPPNGRVPGSITAAIYLIIGSMYEHREHTIVGTIAGKLPALGVDDLLLRHRIDMSMA